MIFYFSGTGNTRWAAEKLAQATGDRLLFIPDELKSPTVGRAATLSQPPVVENLLPSTPHCCYTLSEDEPLGFCFPVHGWQPPHIVRQFIRRLTINIQTSNLKPQISNHKPQISNLKPQISNLKSQISNLKSPYTYALCTCGDSIGLSMQMFSQELEQRGISLHSCQSLVMPESYVCLPFMYTDKPERERQKIEQAEKDLEQFIAVVKQRTSGYSSLKLGLTPWTFSHVIGAYFNRYMITDRKFTVDADACTHCGRCEKGCPVGDIVLQQGLPTWKHDSSCTCCLSCYHHCPVHAINYGQITRRRGQYYFGH